MPPTVEVTLVELIVYPVKSCRGIAVGTATVTARGLAHDREWLVVDEDGRFLTQREYPQLAWVETALTSDSLRLSSPRQSTGLTIPLAQRDLRTLQVQIWRDTCAALEEGPAAAEWFSALLGKPVRLVRFDPEHRRLCSPEWTAGAEAENQFSDGFSLMLVGQESLDDLNMRLSERLPMNRFRPNLVVSGLPAFAEDQLVSLCSGNLEIRPVKPCVRCSITTTDQQTLEIGREPLRTLATFRHDKVLCGVTFGMNAIVTGGAGSQLTVGTTLTGQYRSSDTPPVT